jgi:hypothetical protein
MRIVALSDQHGHLPEIPSCDLLIIAGDICPDRFGPFWRCTPQSSRSPGSIDMCDRGLVDEGTAVPTSDGPISVWATPWSNQFMQWAFMKAPGKLEALYAEIPEGIDVLVSHQPPYGYGDRSFDVGSGRVEHLGSRELLAAIERVRPRLAICGHIHDGYGRTEYAGIPIYNVSLVDGLYRLVHAPTVIDLCEI